ncbi:MAG: aspartate aminotransferase family protein [Desulfobacterota bacterium]|nr:aspartate aminotransferase family protein [Thermodesulfobacteriota bacterium]
MQDKIISKANELLANTYKRFPIVVTRGEGCWVWDLTGRRYLDFISGIAVCNLGHTHRGVVSAIASQLEKLTHISNLFYNDVQVKAAEMLIEHSFGDKVFFCNSGAEANEAAIKLARRYSYKKYGPSRFKIVTMENSFHGRTLATLSATGQNKVKEGFEPLLPGFIHVPFNSKEKLEEAINEGVCAVIIELVQGEGGVRIADFDYVQFLREITEKNDIILIVDEVQTGIGRTGKLFAYEHYGIEPDLMTLAKALGNGFPCGALVGKERYMEVLEVGTHASTFGGNPLAASAIFATLNTIFDEGLLTHAQKVGDYLGQGLANLKERFGVIREIRGLGLMWGIEIEGDGERLVRDFFEEGILINCTQGNVLRILPPLIVEEEQIDLFLEIAERIMGRYENQRGLAKNEKRLHKATRYNHR